MSTERILWCALLLSIAGVQCVWADNFYSLADLGTMDLDTAHATSLDSKGNIVGGVGRSTFLHSTEHAFLYSQGTMHDLHDAVVKTSPITCGRMDTTAKAITDSGLIMGWIGCNGYHGSSFFYQDGEVHFISGSAEATSKPSEFLVSADAPGNGIHLYHVDGNGVRRDSVAIKGVTGYAIDMNSAGQVIGWFVDPTSNQSRAWLWKEGQLQELGTLGGRFSRAHAINAAGQVVGEADTTDERHAFLYSDGLMRDLGTLGGQDSVAHAVNSSGQIVGESSTEPAAGRGGSSLRHAFLYVHGAMKDLNRHLTGPTAAFVTLVQARAINESGMIIANGLDSRRTGRHAGLRAYLLTPLAERP